jgi:UDP-glucose 4-epimerase
VIFDNFSNAHINVVSCIQKITKFNVPVHIGDLRSSSDLEDVFQKHKFGAVMHFAGLKSVGESSIMPTAYYDNNVVGTVTLLKAMEASDVKRLVFSSSATVYGNPTSLPLKETMPIGVSTNPYGNSKIIIERMLHDLCQSNVDWSIFGLRYFNPCGAHESGLIGESPQGVPNNLVPYICQVLTGSRSKLSIFGNDYETSDGTGVRDFIHVNDLAAGHLSALRTIFNTSGFRPVNLGTGVGYSVLEILGMFEKVSGKKINYDIIGRRSGDVASCYADPTYALSVLGWEAKLNLEDMCRDAWNWQCLNPNGFV